MTTDTFIQEPLPVSNRNAFSNCRTAGNFHLFQDEFEAIVIDEVAVVPGGAENQQQHKSLEHMDIESM